MSEPRGTQRGSRTAALLMFLAFLPVLGLAVLGAAVTTHNQEEALREAVDRANDGAETALRSALRSVWEDGIVAALAAARQVRGLADLDRLRPEGRPGTAALLEAVFPVDVGRGEILWVDGVHRLHVSDRRREEIREEGSRSELRAREAEDVRGKARLAEKKVEAALELVRDFPFRTANHAGAYPTAIGTAKWLLDETSEEFEFHPGQPDAVARHQQALLAAVELIALHKDGQGLLDWNRDLLDGLRDRVDAHLMAIPQEHAHVRREVEAFRAARDLFRQDGLLATFVFQQVEEARRAGTLDSVRTVGDRLLGITLARRGEAHDRVVVLDPRAAARLVTQRWEPTLTERLGVALQVVPSGALTEGRPFAALDLREHQVGGQSMGLALRAELHRIHDPPTTPGKGDAFYLVIVFLSAGGLVLSGFVLFRLYRREVHLARLKADFVSNLSHELKTPLTSISLFTEMLQDGKLASEEDRREGLEILAQESARLQRIVARMIDTARREARGTPYDLRAGDLNGPVEHAAARLRRLVTEPGLDLVLDLAPGPLGVRMDPAAMDDAVTNLLSNAWKYRRGEQARIELRTARRGRKAEVVVQDDGIGIPRHERRRVFEMFYRADAYLARPVSGTGLGLALVRSIVRAHRGSIRIEPGPDGVGTRFRMRFPLLRAFTPSPGQDDGEASPPPSIPTLHPEPDLNPKTEASATS